ncbi:MAG: HIT family protein [Dehalococcoidia bacterium]|nr:HIT family protein [Dehalococcoidia bacterium]
MARMTDCPMCQGPMFAADGSQHPQKIAELDVCTVIVNRDWQFYKGSAVLVYQDHVTELHHLSTDLQNRFLADGSRVAAALEKTYPGIRLNHGLFGNMVPHLHWHMVVRRPTDPDPKSTIWEAPIPNLDLSDEDIFNTASEILANL